ncbi:unnamed protein product, partial [Schistosoma curassoni]|uniref:TPR_REGION domain-containing protein n=1 Tax=Schistosoma curassoni TaxID=6186 RepID=A0A183L6C3_9TREM
EKSEAELTPETPLEAALALKLKGNKFFKGGQYSQAISLYDEGLKKCPLDAVQVSTTCVAHMYSVPLCTNIYMLK